LRAAISRILENLKNNVDTTLYEAAPLTAPDMSQKAGVTSSSAGTPKLSMKTETPAAAPPAAPSAPPPVMSQAPFAAAVAPEPIASPFENPFDAGEAGVEVEDDPFAQIPVAVAEPEPSLEIDDPFAEHATALHDEDAERAELEELLANARAMVASLETALERARENERVLNRKLQG
jgi:hypothetical protein